MVEKELSTLEDARRVFIGGNSTGVTIALATFLKFKGGRLGGVVGLNGAHHANINYSNLDMVLKRKTPIFLNSGKLDKLFPANISELSYKVLYNKAFTLFLQKENNLD